jgi:hypothetical protein
VPVWCQFWRRLALAADCPAYATLATRINRLYDDLPRSFIARVHNARPRVPTTSQGLRHASRSRRSHREFAEQPRKRTPANASSRSADRVGSIDDLPPHGDKSISVARAIGQSSGGLAKRGPGPVEPVPSGRHKLTFTASTRQSSANAHREQRCQRHAPMPGPLERHPSGDDAR